MLEIITDVSPAKNLNRVADVEQNIQNARREFVGKPEICHELVRRIIYLRREIDTKENIEAFFDLWERYQEVLLKEYDVRWLLSVVDTVVDVGSDLEAAVAMNITQCVNQCNIHAGMMVNMVDGRFDAGKLRQEIKVPTWGGMITPDFPNGDMIYNMQVRLDSVVSTVPMLDRIWGEIKSRLRDEPNLPMNILCGASNRLHQRKYFL